MTKNIKIRRQNRKSLVMRLTPDGVLVCIPRWLKHDSPEVQAFIAQGLEKLDDRIRTEPPPVLTAEDEILRMVDTWAARIGVQPKRVRMRTMYTRWGSCSSRENINLNRNLRYLPPRLVEYVVVHELVHLRVFSHSKEFWALVADYLPDWKARRDAINRYRF